MHYRFRLSPLIAMLAVILATPAPTLAEHLDDDVDLEHEVVPFIVKMDVGDPDHTIAENGDLKVFVRCGNPSGSLNRVETFGTSSSPFAGFLNVGPLNPANTEVLMTDLQSSFREFNRDVDQGSFVQDGTHYIGIDGESQSQGVNIFGFDCFTAGTAVLITEDDDDD